MRLNDKHLTIGGVTVYATENGIADAMPLTVDASVTLPEIAFPTMTIASMGESTIPDQFRASDMQITVSCTNGKAIKKMFRKGLQTFVFRFAEQIQAVDGTVGLVGFSGMFSGFIQSKAAESLAVGEQRQSDATFAVQRYILFEGTEELVNIDRIGGVLRINGEDFRGVLDALL